MRKLKVILGIILLIVISGYIFLRFVYLKVPDYKPNTSKSISPIDLRPSIIAKLQQLVIDGSNGLYRLTINKINPDLITSTLDIFDATLTPDTPSIRRLDQLKLAPDDIFRITVHSIHIDGIGITDLLNTKKIDIKRIRMVEPIIEVYHSLKPYNESTRERNDSLSLYHRLMKQMQRIAIGNIQIEHGKFIDQNLTHSKTTKKFNDINIAIKDVLIDSSTQQDKDRFLFAKTADISCKDYAILTPDSLYDFKIDHILISGEKHSLVATGVTLKPHGGKEAFNKKIKYRKEMYTADFPKVTLSGANWWAILHRDKFIAERADIDKGSFLIYLDNTPPTSPTIKIANFPDQLLMKIPVPISIAKIKLKHIKLTYEEYEPKIKKNGFAYFDNVEAEITNVTNMASIIKKNKNIALVGSASFMHSVMMKTSIQFDLTKYREGVFSAYVHMDSMSKEVLNPVTETMALFSFKSGYLNEGIAHVTGNNNTSQGDVLLLYNDLHITPLKTKEDSDGQLKKKAFTGLIANTLLIKNNNPTGHQNPRHPVFSMDRDHHGNFFNFVWTTILTGVLKTVGIPPRLVVKHE